MLESETLKIYRALLILRFLVNFQTTFKVRPSSGTVQVIVNLSDRSIFASAVTALRFSSSSRTIVKRFFHFEVNFRKRLKPLELTAGKLDVLPANSRLRKTFWLFRHATFISFCANRACHLRRTDHGQSKLHLPSSDQRKHQERLEGRRGSWKIRKKLSF